MTESELLAFLAYTSAGQLKNAARVPTRGTLVGREMERSLDPDGTIAKRLEEARPKPPMESPRRIGTEAEGKALMSSAGAKPAAPKPSPSTAPDAGPATATGGGGRLGGGGPGGPKGPRLVDPLGDWERFQRQLPSSIGPAGKPAIGEIVGARSRIPAFLQKILAAMRRNPVLAGLTAAGGLAGTGFLAKGLMSGGGAAPAAAPAAALADAPAAALADVSAAGGDGAAAAAGGMDPRLKALLLAGGLGLGGYGLYRAFRGKDKEDDEVRTNRSLRKASSDLSLAERAVVRVLEKRSQDYVRAFTIRLLDKTAAVLPLAGQVSVRALQAGLAAGASLGVAVKAAYPHLTPEACGVVCLQVAKVAAEAMNKPRIRERETFTGKPADGQNWMRSSC